MVLRLLCFGLSVGPERAKNALSEAITGSLEASSNRLMRPAYAALPSIVLSVVCRLKYVPPTQAAGADKQDVVAVCCCAAGVDRTVDEERMRSWLAESCPDCATLLAYNDAVGALAR